MLHCVCPFNFIRYFKRSRNLDLGDYLLSREIIDPQGLDEEIVVDAIEKETGTSVRIYICPGTGYRCILNGHTPDGDPTYYSSLKGYGQPNIIIVL